MGKNKDRLNQKSIPWADSILDQVMNLPPAGGEDLQSTAEAQTTAVEELMKMVNRKIAMNNGEGQYVWNKYEKVTKVVTNPKISLTKGTNSMILSSDDVDLSNVTEEFFDGFIFTGGSSWYFVYENNTLYYNSGSNRYPMTYDPATQVLTGFSDEGVFMYTGDKEVLVIEAVGYVVSSDIDAYPNGDELDGYWYELIDDEEEDAESPAYEVHLFTPSSNIQTITISHGLGVVPSCATICRLRGAGNPETNTIDYVTNVGREYTKTLYGAYDRYSSHNNITVNAIQLTANTVTYEYINGTPYLGAGITYAVVVAK